MADALALLKTKFYPVDLDRKIIYLQPFQRESDLAWKWRARPGCIGLPGRRLMAHGCYAEFQRLPAPSGDAFTVV